MDHDRNQVSPSATFSSEGGMARLHSAFTTGQVQAETSGSRTATERLMDKTKIVAPETKQPNLNFRHRYATVPLAQSTDTPNWCLSGCLTETSSKRRVQSPGPNSHSVSN